MDTFIEVDHDSEFPLENLPFGVFSDREMTKPRPGVAIGTHVVDLTALHTRGFLTGPELNKRDCLREETLNAFMECGEAVWKETRQTLLRLLSAKEGILRDDPELQRMVLLPQENVTMHLPATIGDFTDFYASKSHASTVGAMFRGPDHALSPNWVHMPIAYHGRSSSVVISGTDIRYPHGQWKPADADQPIHAPSAKVDYELEMGLFVGPGNELGMPIDIKDAHKHAFGCVLLNDWSLRDVQFWEGQPLGPFTSKNFASTISPWIVTMEALEPFLCDLPPQDPPVLPYLHTDAPRQTYDIQLQVDLQATEGTPVTIARSNLKNIYWSFSQMLAHHTVTGCNLRPGDLLGSGTLSANDPDMRGCFLERTRNGSEPVTYTTHEGSTVTRSYLQRGDRVILRGWCEKENTKRIGFGTCEGRLVINGA